MKTQVPICASLFVWMGLTSVRTMRPYRQLRPFNTGLGWTLHKHFDLELPFTYYTHTLIYTEYGGTKLNNSYFNPRVVVMRSKCRWIPTLTLLAISLEFITEKHKISRTAFTSTVIATDDWVGQEDTVSGSIFSSVSWLRLSAYCQNACWLDMLVFANNW